MLVLGEAVEAPAHRGMVAHWWITTHRTLPLGSDLTIFSVMVTSVHKVVKETAKAPKLIRKREKCSGMLRRY